jgi:hypothetical protein
VADVAPTEPRSGGFPRNVDGIVDAKLCEDNHFVEHRVAKQFGRVKKCSSDTTAATPTKASLYPSTSPRHTFSAETLAGDFRIAARLIESTRMTLLSLCAPCVFMALVNQFIAYDRINK